MGLGRCSQSGLRILFVLFGWPISNMGLCMWASAIRLGGPYPFIKSKFGGKKNVFYPGDFSGCLIYSLCVVFYKFTVIMITLQNKPFSS